MHDAVALANWIVSLESPSMVDVNNAFKEYQAERYPIAKEELEQNQGFTNVLGKVRDKGFFFYPLCEMLINDTNSRSMCGVC